MRRDLTVGLVLAIVNLAVPAWAAEQSSTPEAVGVGTQAWVDLQKSGTAASQAARPLPGDIADKIYDRYAQSFTHPIPGKFERDSFSGGSGSGGGGGGGGGSNQ